MTLVLGILGMTVGLGLLICGMWFGTFDVSRWFRKGTAVSKLTEREAWKDHLTRQISDLVALLRAREEDFPGIMQEALEAAQAQDEDRRLLEDPALRESLRQMRDGETRAWTAVREELKEELNEPRTGGLGG